MRRFFLTLFRRRRLQHDLETELAFHQEMSRETSKPDSGGQDVHDQRTSLRPLAFQLRREPLA
jgi:hypothetical protein